jgi:soluble lytic murein transglycosylase
MSLDARRLSRLLTCAAIAALVAGTAAEAKAPRGKGAAPAVSKTVRGKPAKTAKKATKPKSMARSKSAKVAKAAARPVQVAAADDEALGLIAAEAAARQLSPELELLRQAVEAFRKGDVEKGDPLRERLADPAALALVDWLAIRSGASLGFDRIHAFQQANPDWPVTSQIRRRAEETLLASRKPAAFVRAFFASQPPATGPGRLALALALKADGAAKDANELIRQTWRADAFSQETEARILELFPDVVTQEDHRFRMERLLFKESWVSAQRAAARAGSDYVLLAKARMAADRGGSAAEKALDAVPQRLRAESSYRFSRALYLRRKDQPLDAAAAMAGVSRDPAALVDGDGWWLERRSLVRKLLDEREYSAAYQVASQHGAESNAQRIEAEFHAGWIALRFLGDPASAERHFGTAGEIAETPISVSRAAYWQGRAAEAAGSVEFARRHYERAAEYPVAYYGQLARRKLGLAPVETRAPDVTGESRTVFPSLRPVQAIQLLHAIGAEDVALGLYADLAQKLADASQLDALGALAAHNNSARAALVVGKTALQRGLPLDRHAYPDFGVPSVASGDERVDPAMVYAITRQESAFNPAAKSHAGARGLMQLMPATAKRTALRFGLGFDVERLTQDPSYNARLGALHLGELMEDWRGSHILAFASYNAGGGNVAKWIKSYGDPRSPHVDAIDWIERIPFYETRNYVQRVLENLHVYRHRLTPAQEEPAPSATADADWP